MKKILIISIGTIMCLLCFNVFLVSCSDDDNNFSKKNLIGTWSQYYMAEFSLDWELNWEDNMSDVLTFNEDGTYYAFNNINKPHSWKLSGNKLTIVREDEVEIYRIQTLTEDELVLKYVWEDQNQIYKDSYSGQHYICKYHRVSDS